MAQAIRQPKSSIFTKPLPPALAGAGSAPSRGAVTSSAEPPIRRVPTSPHGERAESGSRELVSLPPWGEVRGERASAARTSQDGAIGTPAHGPSAQGRGEKSPATAPVQRPEVGGSAADVPEESLRSRLTRNVLGLARSLKPARVRHAPGLALMVAAHYLQGRDKRRRLPDPSCALNNPEGTAGIITHLDADTMLAGFRAGLYACGHAWPLKWCTPGERMVVPLGELKIETNLRRRIRNGHFTVTFDQAPMAVLEGCAAPREGRWPLTWLTPRLMRCYLDLFQQGHMHTVEVWDKDGTLAGGLFGVAVGPVFSIMSQFSAKRDASKVATTVIACHLEAWGYSYLDGQLDSPHLRNLGFRPISRGRFQNEIAGGRLSPKPAGRWQVDATLDAGNWQPGSRKRPAFGGA